MPPEQRSTQLLHKTPVAIGIAVVALLVLAATVFYMNKKSTAPVEYQAPNAPVVGEPSPTQKDQSLGGALYEKASNPLENKLPEQSPVANPLDEAYKNPF